MTTEGLICNCSRRKHDALTREVNILEFEDQSKFNLYFFLASGVTFEYLLLLLKGSTK